MSRTFPERTKRVASSATNGDLLGDCDWIERVEARDDHGDVLEIGAFVEARGEPLRTERAEHIRVGLRQLTEWPTLVGRTERVALHDRVGIISQEAALVHE